jgi:hypothetical protein
VEFQANSVLLPLKGALEAEGKAQADPSRSNDDCPESQTVDPSFDDRFLWCI